jgi:hypothetical protein
MLLLTPEGTACLVAEVRVFLVITTIPHIFLGFHQVAFILSLSVGKHFKAHLTQKIIVHK